MDNLLLSFSTVFPLLFYMLTGMGMRKVKIFSEESLTQLNKAVFKVFLPCSIFSNVYSAQNGGQQPGPILLLAVCLVVGLFLVSWLVFAHTVKERGQKGVMIQNAFRSNFVLFGVPLGQLLLNGRGTGLTELLIAIIIPAFNILAVIILQYYGESKASFKKVIKGIVTNPLIVAVVLGLLVKKIGIVIPDFLYRPVKGLAAVATPLSLIVLGGQFNFRKSRNFISQLIAGVVARLLAAPALTLGVAVLLGFRGEVLIAFISMFASPVAVSSYTMAQQMNCDHELAGQLLVYTSVFCSFSLFLIIFVFKQAGFI